MTTKLFWSERMFAIGDQSLDDYKHYVGQNADTLSVVPTYGLGLVTHRIFNNSGYSAGVIHPAYEFTADYNFICDRDKCLNYISQQDAEHMNKVYASLYKCTGDEKYNPNIKRPTFAEQYKKARIRAESFNVVSHNPDGTITDFKFIWSPCCVLPDFRLHSEPNPEYLKMVNKMGYKPSECFLVVGFNGDWRTMVCKDLVKTSSNRNVNTYIKWIKKNWWHQ